MSDSSTPQAPSARPADPRAAARAAALARFATPGSPSASTSTSAATVAQPAAAGAAAGESASPSVFRAATPNTFQPTEKEERDTRIKFSRLLDRGLVRDNGYKQVAEGVEVSDPVLRSTIGRTCNIIQGASEYRKADAMQTLLSIARNIQNSNDPKYRDLKENNKTLQTKVLNLKGGHDYLIAVRASCSHAMVSRQLPTESSEYSMDGSCAQLGFRVATVDFVRHYLFHNSVKSSWELGIGADTLAEHVSIVHSLAASTPHHHLTLLDSLRPSFSLPS